MSILFLLKLEFTLIILVIPLTVLCPITPLNAENFSKNNPIAKISKSIEKLEYYKGYIPLNSFDVSKELVSKINSNSDYNLDPELLDIIAKVHIDFLNTLVAEAENNKRLDKINDKIKEEQQKYDKLSKYNKEISDELKNYK